VPFETELHEGVLRLGRPETRWLATGFGGGYRTAPAAYNVTVPTGFDRTDLAAYLRERRQEAGFDADGPGLLTGVEMEHARGARAGPVVAVATAGVSNPAALPVGKSIDRRRGRSDDHGRPRRDGTAPHHDGTVNVLVGTTRTLDEGALASLLGVVVEAKAATLLARTGFPGTTSDAVVVGTATDGEPATFAGSATTVGAAARACVRAAVDASLDARYVGTDATVPASVADAEHGVVTDERARRFDPATGEEPTTDRSETDGT
jgi:adenosylcobinamide hydrolase